MKIFVSIPSSLLLLLKPNAFYTAKHDNRDKKIYQEKGERAQMIRN